MRLSKGLLNVNQINGTQLNNILGITIGNERIDVGVVIGSVKSFKTRVLNDLGTFESETCLTTTLEKLNNIN